MSWFTNKKKSSFWSSPNRWWNRSHHVVIVYNNLILIFLLLLSLRAHALKMSLKKLDVKQINLFLIRAYWNHKSRQGPNLACLACCGGHKKFYMVFLLNFDNFDISASLNPRSIFIYWVTKKGYWQGRISAVLSCCCEKNRRGNLKSDVAQGTNEIMSRI